MAIAGMFSLNTRRIAFCTLLVTALTLAACATQPHPEAHAPPGFFSGLLHGLTMPFALVGSIFTDYRIYAFPNSGGWYDFGFVLGASALMGGGGVSVRWAPPNQALNRTGSRHYGRPARDIGQPHFDLYGEKHENRILHSPAG